MTLIVGNNLVETITGSDNAFEVISTTGVNGDVIIASPSGNVDIMASVSLPFPVSVTATGGTVARSLQARFADVANVLDFGADPTGVGDSTAAFNAACALNRKVYAPAGTYKITDAINIPQGTSLCGDSSQTTLLSITTAFNMSALGVLVLGSASTNGGFPLISDLWVRFSQPASPTRGTLIQYPPAIYKGASSNAGRPFIQRMQITNAWVGMSMDNVVCFIDELNMSAYSYGILWSPTQPTLDVVHLSNVHFWSFDMTANQQAVMDDGTTNGAYFNRIDGLYATNCFFESSIVTINAGASPGGGYYFFNTLGLDGANSQLLLQSNIVCTIHGFYNSKGSTGTTPSVTVTGGRNSFSNSNIQSSMTSASAVLVSGGGVLFNGGPTWFKEGAASEMVTVTGGTCSLADITLGTHTSTHTAPFVHQSGTGVLTAVGVLFETNASTGTAIQVDAANVGNFIGADNYYASLTPLAGSGLITKVIPQSVTLQNTTTATTAQLSLMNSGTTNSLESKLRLHGTFPTGTDYGEYVAASLRGGWASTAWNGGYLNVWVSSTSNGSMSDAGMAEVGNFSINGFNLPAAGLAYSINGTKVVGAQQTGWGTSSNGVRGALNGSTATLAQTSAALAQLLIDLKAHGLIGT